MALLIVGLGPGTLDDCTRRALRAIDGARTILLRTARHPAAAEVIALYPERARALDSIYEAHDAFEAVYGAIIEQVMAAAREAAPRDLVYAVPGDPMVAEAAVRGLIARCEADGIACQIISGVSFIEPIAAALGIDPSAGLQLYDAIDLALMHHPPLNPDTPALLGQVYSRALASDLKLTLMNQYPDDFEVTLIHQAGGADQHSERVMLHEIDHSEHIGVLTALYLPALGNMSSFERFQETIAHLRAPEGCPWDRKQTHESLRRYLLEEAYEVIDAIDDGDPGALRDELGDVLLQIVLHTQIAIDDGEFHMGDVIRAINEKMIRRHPHVWGDTVVNGAEGVVTHWEAIKAAENAAKGVRRESVLDGIPRSQPALQTAYEMQARSAKVGFDWPTIDGVIAKVREELDEVLTARDAAHQAEELGDLIFILTNWARWIGVDPETALRATNAKYRRRFTHVEARAAEHGQPLTGFTLDEMNAWWNEAKAIEREEKGKG